MEDADSFLNNPGRTLTVSCEWGLCNRLRVLLSGFALARATGRKFRMFWPKTSDCSAGFSDLFVNDWGVIDKTLCDHSQKLLRALGTYQRLPDFLIGSDKHLVLSSDSWLIQPRVHSRHRELMEACRELFGELLPVGAIGNSVDQVRDSQFRSKVIGVHVRRGDFANPRARPHVASGLSQTFKAIDFYLKEAPEAGIFLCTDDGAPHPKTGEPTTRHGIRELFADRFSDRLVLAPTASLDRSTTLAIQEALVELLLLRHTDYFVGTQDSSFSEMVAFSRKGPTTLCADSSTKYARQERIARLTGVYNLALWYGQAKLDPTVPFHVVWNLWLPGQIQILPRRVFARITGRPFRF